MLFHADRCVREREKREKEKREKHCSNYLSSTYDNDDQDVDEVTFAMFFSALQSFTGVMQQEK